MPSILLGVDTGGTFTDAVAINATSNEVLSSAKALTTRDDLATGVSEALEQAVSGIDVRHVSLVSVSTTLATNAVVEGHGSPILVLLVGFDEPMIERTGISEAFADALVFPVSGGHAHHGSEKEPLDLSAASALIAQHGSHVGAVAVASTFAVRNPDHEHQIRDLIMAETELAVTVSSSLSDSLDAPRRALTTALNARLLSRISDLIEAVERSVASLGVEAPIMVAKGDGSLAVAESVARRPIETVLSGPAASIVGAAALTGLNDFVLSDIGGTTTDVALVRDGRPRLVADGARVGQWRTMVEAIDVRTTGLGGDSAVRTEKQVVTLGPDRRVPLSLLAQDDESIVSTLRAQLVEPPSRDFAGVFVRRVGAGGGDSLGAFSSSEATVLARLSHGVAPLVEVARGTLERRAVDALAERGLVLVAGFTPSDAAHVLGHQENWNGEAASAGAELFAWYTGEEPRAFSERVWSEAVRVSAGCVLDVAFEETVADSLANPVTASAAAGERALGAVSVSLDLDVPIVAVGGPARVYYPEVAKRIGADAILPDDFAVANAVGAAVGHVVARGEGEVHPDGPGSYRILGVNTNELTSDAAEAIERATAIARAAAMDSLADATAGIAYGEIEERVEVTRYVDPNGKDDSGLYGATVEVELRTRPR